MWMFSGQAKGKNLMKSSESEIRAQPTKKLFKMKLHALGSFSSQVLMKIARYFVNGV